MFLTAMLLTVAAPDQSTTAITGESLAKPGGVVTHPATWVTTDDYPISARRAKREGRTEFRVYYGTNGKPTRCEIVASSGHDDLDELTCSLVRMRARFKPGKDDRGMDMGGYYQNVVNWGVPRR